MSEQCEGCGEDILQSGTVREGLLERWVVCNCGTNYPVESR